MNKRFNKPCNFFQNGGCKNGDNCPYLHGDSNMNTNTQGGQNKINKQCGFFASGKCRKGDNCEYLHGNSDMIINSNNPPQNRQNFQNKGFNKNICRKFLEGKCGNDNCNYQHRYDNNLDFMTKVPLYDNQFVITGICKTPNSNSLITSTENKITIWELPLKPKDEKTLEGKITNLLFSNYKLIVGTQMLSTFSPKSHVYVFVDDMTVVNFDTETRKINEIIEIMKYVSIGDSKEQISIIFIAGEGFIEVWGLRKTESQKITTLSCDDHSEVLTLAFNEEKSMLFAGYRSGNLSAWQLDEVNFKLLGVTKLHNDAINKLVFHRSNFLISCSSDSTVKIYDLLNDKVMDLNIGIQAPIINLYLSKNYENEDIFLFILKSNDIIACKETDNGFLQIFTVPSFQGSTRFVLDYENPKKDKITGDYILFTDGDFLDINVWESQSATKETFNKNNNFQHNQNFGGQKHNKFNTHQNNQQNKGNSGFGGFNQNRGNFMGGKRGNYN